MVCLVIVRSGLILLPIVGIVGVAVVVAWVVIVVGVIVVVAELSVKCRMPC